VVKAETVLGDFGKEIGITPRHLHVVQRAQAPRRVDAHGHQKGGPGTSDFLERHVHANLVHRHNISVRTGARLCRLPITKIVFGNKR